MGDFAQKRACARTRHDKSVSHHQIPKLRFTEALKSSWYLHTRYYRFSFAIDVVLFVIACIWLARVDTGYPRLRSGFGHVPISPSARDLYLIVATVRTARTSALPLVTLDLIYAAHILQFPQGAVLQAISLLHGLYGLFKYDADYFRMKLAHVDLVHRGAYCPLDGCTDEIPMCCSCDVQATCFTLS